MSRIKRGLMHSKRRRKLLKTVKGFKWGRKNLIKLAQTAITKAGAHAYVGRRLKKRTARSLWQIKINAAARLCGLKYSDLINRLKKHQIKLDRKILADLGEKHPTVFKQLIESIE
jgi:large subunit ribosomal protein L20